MKLYVVRHADAAGGPVDAERSLSEMGVRDVQRMAAFLSRSDCKVARVIHSGRVRALESATLLAQVVNSGGVVEEASGGLGPDDSPRGVAEAATGWKEDVMLVSHQPFVSRLISLLSATDESAGVVEMPTSSVACLERHQDSSWSLQWLATPALLGQ
jgi:phosphohistidine phosphatase